MMIKKNEVSTGESVPGKSAFLWKLGSEYPPARLGSQSIQNAAWFNFDFSRPTGHPIRAL